MKTPALLFLLMIPTASFIACGKSTGQSKNPNTSSNVVEVYYFHFERRCASCIALEKVTKETIESFYSDKIKEGKLVFKVLNLDKHETEPIAEKFMAVMPTLLIVKGDNIKDMTDFGFRFASSEADKFKQELKSVIDSLLKG